MGAVTLQFSTQRGWASGLIRWFGHGQPYSHVDFVLPGGRLLGSRTDAPVSGQTGVQIRPANYAKFSAVLRVSIQTPHAAAIYAAARSQIGKPYDRRGIIGFVCGRNWRDTDSWFCSELAAWAFEQGGFWDTKWVVPYMPQKVDPADLFLLLGPYMRLDTTTTTV